MMFFIELIENICLSINLMLNLIGFLESMY